MSLTAARNIEANRASREQKTNSVNSADFVVRFPPLTPSSIPSATSPHEFHTHRRTDFDLVAGRRELSAFWIDPTHDDGVGLLIAGEQVAAVGIDAEAARCTALGRKSDSVV